MAPKSVQATLNYQSERVPRSLTSTGQVYLDRATTGSDAPPVGLDSATVDVTITDGRGAGYTLDANAFQLVDHSWQHVDYLDEDQILGVYYPECCELVKRFTGAKQVYAFDHNVRVSEVASWMNDAAAQQPKPALKGGNEVQGPAMVVHNDYTLTSAPRRVELLAERLRANDTLAKVIGDRPLLPPEDLPQLLAGRWALINVWRNIALEPVQDKPLAMCDGAHIPKEDLVTVEIRYTDRTGENYLARHTEHQKWVYFPQMTRDEAILLKVWDSAGAGFATEGSSPVVPATFTLHSAFRDPTAEPGCPPRQSIEVRTVAFY